MPMPGIINQPRSRSVVFIWPDGTRKTFSWAFLRAVCPCAVCREERARQASDPLLLTPRIEDTLADFQYVGRYAIQLTWGDGHAYGIYSWKMLKELPEDRTEG